ncbi:MAG: DUF2593 family protein [Candidatus Omnitrophica bacterium]|nr:DUF2593 family protein [Candidatus Omnitrophota bacterium]MCF7887726.1 DUF2593 family protein [Candidatus Omnitrophota bacterium]
MKKETIFWVKLIGKAGVIYGLIQLVSLPMLFQEAKADYLNKWSNFNAPEWGLLAIFYSSFIIIPALVTLVGIGLVRVKSWGRVLGILTSLYFIVINLLNSTLYFNFMFPQIPDQSKNMKLLMHLSQEVPMTILYAFVLFFLTKKTTKELFRKTLDR